MEGMKKHLYAMLIAALMVVMTMPAAVFAAEGGGSVTVVKIGGDSSCSADWSLSSTYQYLKEDYVSAATKVYVWTTEGSGNANKIKKIYYAVNGTDYLYSFNDLSVENGHPWTTMSSKSITIYAAFGSEAYLVVTKTGDNYSAIETSDYVAQAGDTITITVTPDEGYSASSLVVKQHNGTSTVTATPTDNPNEFTFTMPAYQVDVSAVCSPTLPDPENLKWSETSPYLATWEWDHEDLKDKVYGIRPTVKWVNDEESDTQAWPATGLFYEQNCNASSHGTQFIKGHGEGQYSFSVQMFATEDSGYEDTNTVWSGTRQFYQADLKIVTEDADGNVDTSSQGGRVGFTTGKATQYYDENDTFVYPEDWNMQFEAIPEVGYAFEGFTVTEAPEVINNDGKNLSFTLDKSVTVTATFKADNSKSAVSLDLGSKHTDLAEAIAAKINSGEEDPYNDYGKLECTVEGSVITVQFPKASATEYDAYAYLDDVLAEYLEDSDYIDEGEMIFPSESVGKKSVDQYDDEDDVMTEWSSAKNTDLGDSLSLYALWQTPVTKADFTITAPVCGTEVKIETSSYGLGGTQDPTPAATAASDSQMVIPTYRAAGFWVTTKDLTISDFYSTDKWFSGDIEGGQTYTAALIPYAKYGYYIDRSNLPSVTINDKEATLVAAEGGLIVIGDVEAEHDWGDWQTTVAPTAISEGTEERVCKNDSDHKETRTLDKLIYSIEITGFEETGTKQGNVIRAIAKVTDPDGNVPTDLYTGSTSRYLARVKFGDVSSLWDGNFSSATGKITLSKDLEGSAEGTQYETTAILAQRASGDPTLATSEAKTVTVITPELELEAADLQSADATGSIKVSGAQGQTIKYYKDGETDTNAVEVSGTEITGLSAGKYYVFTEKASAGNNTFYTRSKVYEVEIKVCTHEWSDVSYVWADDNSTVTASRSCSNCGKTETEEVSATSEITQVADCTLPEITTWTSADFTNTVFEKQTKEVETSEALGHDWSDWEVVKEATTTSTGLKERTCSRCNEVEQEEIPKLTPANNGSKSTVKKVLVAKAVAKGKRKGVISWNNVKADRYVIYMAKCNFNTSKYKLKKVKTVSGKKLKYTTKKLKKNKCYKFKVVAQKKVNGKYKNIATSYEGHFCTNNVRGSFTNPKSMKLNKTKVTLKKGGTVKLSAKVTKVKKSKKLATTHCKLLRYKSNNPAVATVNASGKVTAKSAGTATIYVQTINGMWKTCKVTVK